MFHLLIDPRTANANGCVPWNFPASDAGIPICKPLERHNFLRAFHTAETDEFVMGGMARCLPNCGGTSYEMTVTSAPFRQCDQVPNFFYRRKQRCIEIRRK
jgi:hypothetical protein